MVAATAVTSIVYWRALTSGYEGPASEIIVRPVAGVLRIGIVSCVYCAMAFLVATLVTGKLPRRVGKHEVEFDEGPTTEAMAGESLDVRVRKLEEAHTVLADAFEEHKESHQSA